MLRRSSRLRAGVLALLPLVVACTPALNWRETRPDGSGARALFPCKPASQSRDITLGSTPLRMTVHACRAGDAVYALGHADVRDPGRVGAALAELRDAAARNLGAPPPAMQLLRIGGMTPNPQAGRARIVGRRPDGSAVREELALFARGTTVYQATVLGENLETQAVETFLAELRLAP